jgi:glycerol-3-phosphate dehydrogenase
VPRLYAHDRCYIFQNADNRILFAIPYEQDFTLIGTTDLDYSGDPGGAAASESEVAYLCKAASEYFATPVDSRQVVWTYAGVRPLFDDGATAAQAATRDYVLKLDAPKDESALLSVYGGKITTYRRLAESALDLLAAHLPPTKGAAGWTATAALPGGDFPPQGFEDQVAALQKRYAFLTRSLARRLTRAYGALAPQLLGAARSEADLGRAFGAGLFEVEVRYLINKEWALTAQDVVWRRTKLGLRLRADEISKLDEFMKDMTSDASRRALTPQGNAP